MDKKRIALNSLSSGLSFIVGAVTIFFLFKYVLEHRGSEELGVWSLILSFTGLTGMGTSVIAGGVIKFVAKYHALNEPVKLTKVIDTNFISFFVLILITIIIGFPILMYFLPTMFEGNFLIIASKLVPVSFTAFFVNSLAVVYLLSLDGLQYYYISQSIRMLGRIAYLVATILLIPEFGILGVAYAYFVYNLLLLVLSKIALHIKLPSISLIPHKFDYSLFKEMLNYGWKFQVTSFSQMTIMPVTKLLLKTFSSLSFVAYFEMAFQLVSTLKGGMSAISNVFTPVYASLIEKNPKSIETLYFQILKISGLFAVIFFPLLFLALPFISYFWIGEINDAFIVSGFLLGIAYMISTVAEPKYILNLGSGNLFPNMITMTLASILTGILGYFIGSFYAGKGVLIGYTTAFIIANLYLIFSGQNPKTKTLKAIINFDNCFISLLGITLLVFVNVFESYINIEKHILCLLTSILFIIITTNVLYYRGVIHEYISIIKK